MVSSIDETKINVELTPPPNTNKQDYTGGTNVKTRDYQTRESDDSRTRKTGDSRSEIDSFAINIDKEHKNEEDDDYIDPPSLKR